MAEEVTELFSQMELSEMFKFLDDLRAIGSTNMFGAAAYLRAEFKIDAAAARKVHAAWMETFSPTPASVRVETIFARAGL